MSKKIIVAIIIIIVVALGGLAAIWWLPKQPESSTSQGSSESNTTVKAAATITYTSSGFQPALTTVHAGDIVRVTNTATTDLMFESDPHPAHTDNTELNLGSVRQGESKTFVVTRTGTWGYHNHLDSGQTGRIEVQ